VHTPKQNDTTINILTGMDMNIEVESRIYGQLGVLAYDPLQDKVECHICGKWFRGLNNHVLRAHGVTVGQYREEFGLNRGQGLICEGTRQRLSVLNKQLGKTKYLVSQTMTKDELCRFMRDIQRGPIRLRKQACLLKSKLLKEHNPMNEQDAKQRALATNRETWYGSPRQRQLSKANIQAGMATLRNRNVATRRWACSCGHAFPTREALRNHQSKEVA
jgi:hypothetical protein